MLILWDWGGSEGTKYFLGEAIVPPEISIEGLFVDALKLSAPRPKELFRGTTNRFPQ